ncbi:DUF4184 family protein [Cellulomonas pakistanensis]|uniref:DUF4184 family protein n=1 Tax=Cellulomonas pakistanensis TaxID=992287 RepID=UPI00194488D2|nr:DUF4184 family protein [Cellulomonas pakistanensis]
MPFTLAHPAAVLPLARRPLVPAALVAGALSPDVPYFLPLPRSADAWYEPFVNATTTHTWPGALTVAVPTAAALLGLWFLVRAPARTLIERDARPTGERPTGERPTGERTSRARTVTRSAWVATSLLLGVLTHVMWDAVTHGDGAVVRHVAWFREPLVGDVPAGRVLQHLSTAIGLLVLAVWAGRAIRAWRRDGVRVLLDRSRVAVVIALVVVGLAGAAIGASGAAGSGLEAALSGAAKVGGAASAAAVLVAAALWWSIRARMVVLP